MGNDCWCTPKQIKIARQKERTKYLPDRKQKKPTVRHLTDKLFSEVKRYRWWAECLKEKQQSWSFKWAQEGVARHAYKIKTLANQIRQLR